MCGIAGISYGPAGPMGEEWTPNEFAHIMFPAMVHRGPHAFGYMWYDGENVFWHKIQGRSDNAMLLKQVDIPNNAQWVVLHVRYATTGNPAFMENNHPVLHGPIIGVHNGIVANYKDILAQTGRYEDEEGTKSEVDSEAIFAAINKWGHKKGLAKVDFDGVVVYASLETATWTLHIARSSERPLVFANTAAGSKIFASESGIIDATGINRSAFSHMSNYRLLRVREGKIVQRIAWEPEDHAPRLLKPKPYTPPRKRKKQKPKGGHFFSNLQREYGDEPIGLRGITDRLSTDPPRSPIPASERGNHPLNGPVTTKKMRNGDRFGDRFYYEGELLTERDFRIAVEDAIVARHTKNSTKRDDPEEF